MGKVEKPAYVYETDSDSKFGMITGDLLRSKTFQGLSKTAQIFYIDCVVHKAEEDQSKLLYNALAYYYASIPGMTSEDVKNDAGQNRKTLIRTTKFVFPEEHLSEYGYSPQLANKYKNELIEKGFIKIAHKDKAHMLEGKWIKMPTVYEFINDWKRL